MAKSRDYKEAAPQATVTTLWTEPEPLPTALHPVMPFDGAMLPDFLRPWLCDIQERVQCPLDYLAVSVMCALGSLIGARVAIRPQSCTDWSEVANQWGLLIGRPAMLKTPAMEQTLAPLKRLAALAIEKHQADLREFKAEALAEKLRAEARERQAREKLKSTPSADIAGLLVADEPVEPTLRRYIANNTTAEALGELLRQNPYGLLVYWDELVSLLRSLEHEEAIEARGFYRQAWNGTGSYTFDRIVRGLNLHIPLVCLSVLGATQPARIASFVRTARDGGEFDDGMLQRFGLMVWPDDPGPWKNVDRFPDSRARATASQVFQYLDRLNLEYIKAQQDTTPDNEPDGLPYLRLSDEALEIFIEWRTKLEATLRSDAYSDALVSHFTKYRKLIPSLALLLHLTDRKTGPVGKVPLLQALSWSEYLREHAIRTYRSGTHAEVPAARAIIAKLRTGALKSPFSSKDVWRPQWTHLTEPEQVGRALTMLVEYGWLAVETQPSGSAGGRPKVVYTANPRWLKS